MFELLDGVPAPGVEALIDVLGIVDAGDSDAEGVDRLRDLEQLKAAACAAQARITEDLRVRADEAERTRRRAAGLLPGVRVPAVEASVGGEVGLARRESPHRGRSLVGLARMLLADLPHTLRLLEAGEISERRAEVIATELSDLSPELRREADDRLASPTAVATGFDLSRLGTAETRDAARRLAIRFDAEGIEQRRRRGRTRRRVSAQVRPDGMCSISGLIGDMEAAAVMGALGQAADLARHTDPGEDRTRAQLVADLFVARLTGQTTATAVPVAIDLVVSAEVLLGDDDSPARLDGPTGPLVIPAAVARQLAAASPDVRATIRRLFAHDGHLVAMESTARAFTGTLRDYIGLRDGARCRTPYCNAPVRHYDHVEAVADGGATSVVNGQGLCEACNYLKEAFGWHHEVVDTTGDDLLDRHETRVTTPTGHTYDSRAPDLPVPIPPPTSRRHDWRWGIPLDVSA